MIERTPERSKGLHRNAIRVWAMLFLTIGLAGTCIIQNRMLGIGELTAQQLLDAMNTDTMTMIYVTLALVCQAVEASATPIFALLLVEGFCHTSDLKNYLIRVLAVAVISEIPYNLAMSGKILDFSSRNPAFGIVLALVTLYLYSRYQDKGIKNTLFKAVLTLAAIIWAKMLGIVSGECVVVISAAFWAYRSKPLMRTMAGCAAAAVCSLFSLFYIAAPMSFVFIYMYNGEAGTPNQKVNYAAYPAILIALAACNMLI